MLVELDEIQDEQEHRRFCLGCLRTVTAMRITTAVSTSPRGGRSLRIGVLGAIVSALSLAAYGLVHYLGRAGGQPWLAGALLLLTLLAYGASTLTLSQGATRQARIARRNGLIGGILIGTAWLFALNPTGPLKPWVAVPLAFAIVAPVGIAILTGHATRDARAAAATSTWSGIIGGLLAYIAWVTSSYLRNGGPYDPQLLRDFHHSGSHDLIAYAVSNNLWSALSLLVLIPLVTVAIGSMTSRVTARCKGAADTGTNL